METVLRGVTRPALAGRIESWLRHVPAVCCRARYLTSLCLTFLTCKNGSGDAVQSINNSQKHSWKFQIVWQNFFNIQ